MVLLKNNLTQMLGVDTPIVQAPMLGVTTPAMVAAASAAGALGSLALGDLPAVVCRDLIRQTKTLTEKPFAVNFFAHSIPGLSNELRTSYNKTRLFVQDLARKHGLEVSLPDIDTISLTNYQDQIDIILEEGCPIVSFTFGNLDPATVTRLKESGVFLIGTCTSVAEAKVLEAAGIDAICVQGIEAGGHRGTFLEGPLPQIGGLSLLAQVYDAVNLPLIYAGGLYNVHTIQAAYDLGAQAFQLGSMFLGSAESALQPFEKERLRNAIESDNCLTKSFTGRYARGLNTTFMTQMEDSGFVLPYPYQNKLTAPLRQLARTQERTDFISLWAGQSLQPYREDSCTTIIKHLINQLQLI
ncbi:NAD(P)H-dependent flavin oxidoreductase [Sphingobacterium psychroaquaticum]|uniref:NAD(P)H-dependent flavin oxidoreductase n=1 Tax=Sphingobacterium psychroaquaticum TaxID=561061 RepID=UPI000A1CBB60|nr:nitronate monooxygenase [Sphingobacterium psychroaquaticum]